MSQRYEELKAQFIREIIGNGSGDRAAVKKRVTRLLGDYSEKENGLIQRLKDAGAGDDNQLLERAKARLQEEKAALDDAILDVSENQLNFTLPILDEITKKARKRLDLPQRQAELPAIIIKSTVRTLYTCLLICLVLFSTPYLFRDWSHISIGGYFEHLYSMARLYIFEGSPLVFYISIVIASTWWWRFFKSYRDKEASRERQ